MNKVYVVSAKRSAIGNMLGTLKNTPATEVGAQVLQAVLQEGKVDPAWLDEVIVGNVLGAGLKQGPGRQVSILAGVPQEITGHTLNMVCGSGMKAVMNAANAIAAGKANLIAAGGTESMSGAPYLVSAKTRSGNKMGDMRLVDHMLTDALTDAYGDIHMGITAENVAEKYGITREMQDAFALNSQKKAATARDAGKFKDEIVPLTVKAGRKEVIFDTDEYIKGETTLEDLQSLRSAFKKDGTVTAGNCSGINDGASFLILASEEAVKEHDLPVLAEVVGWGQGGVDPNFMGIGPVPAIRAALKDAGLQLSDMGLLELNEAFAAQSLGVVKLLSEEHGIPMETLLERCNVNGGAIALGHPVGCSGNRILVTLLYEMKKRGTEYGVASLCIGGGMGTAVILKNVK